MIVSVLQENFVKALEFAIKAVDKKAVLPVLYNIKLETEDARLKISATDLEIMSDIWIGAKVHQDGAITLPAKELLAVVKAFPKTRIDMQLDVTTLTVHIVSKAPSDEYDDITAELKGIDYAEFPTPKPIERQAFFSVYPKHLADALQRVLHSTSKEDNRPILTGVSFTVDAKNNTLELAAADGYRLAVQKIDVEEVCIPDEINTMVVPAKVLNILMTDITKNKDWDRIEVYFEPHYSTGETKTYYKGGEHVHKYNIGKVLFRQMSADLTAITLEGKFPDYSAIVPRSYVTAAVFSRIDMLKLLDRAKVYAKDNAQSINLSFINDPVNGKDKIVVKAKSNERGVFEQSIPAHIDGESFDTSFNCSYLIDGLKNMEIKKDKDADKVHFESNGKDAPMVLKYHVYNTPYIYITMPMSVGR